MTIRTRIYILIFLFIGINSFGQKKIKIDSLKKVLFDVKIHDTIKINTYLSLISKYQEINIDSMNYYSKAALIISRLNNDYKLVRIYISLGVFQSSISNMDSARVFYDKALKFLDIKDEKRLRYRIYGNYSLTYEKSNNLKKELEYSLKAINLTKGNDSELSWLYFNHASIYDDAGFTNQSKKYLRLAYLYSKKSKEYRVEYYSIGELADYCINEKKYDSAKVYLNRGLELCEITKSSEAYFVVNASLGKLYDVLKMYKKANSSLKIAMKHAVSLKQNFYIMICYQRFGEHEMRKGNYKKSSYFFNEFEKLYDKQVVHQLGVVAYKSWAETEMKLKNYKKSNILMLKYINAQDSIYTLKNKNLLVNADIKYQTEKKDKEILQQKIKLQQQKTRYNNMAGVAIFLLIGAILTWFLFQQRQKHKNQEIVTLKREHQIKTLETLIEGEEKERFRIAKELHDGVNGDLSAIKFKLSSLLEMNNNVVKEAITMIDNSCNQVRAISHNLVPPSLESFNLAEATEIFCNNMDETHPIKIDFQYIGESLNISKKAQINMYRIVQELVNNAIKHAKSSEINVQMSCRNKLLQITVEDNGKGFDKNNIKGNGIGLNNIKSRAEFLHANLDIISDAKGTSTTIEIDTTKLDDY